MLCGRSPFCDMSGRGDQTTICRNILHAKLKVRANSSCPPDLFSCSCSLMKFPRHLTDRDAKTLIDKLLNRDAALRLGCLRKGVQDIKDAAWFREIDWVVMPQKTVRRLSFCQ